MATVPQTYNSTRKWLCVPTFEPGQHTMIHPRKCSTRWCLGRPLHRSVSLAPLGSTIKQGSSPDAVPNTRITSPMPPEPVRDATGSPTCVTFADYIANLPLWERDLLARPKTDFCVMILPCMTYCSKYPDHQRRWPEDDCGSFGWLIGAK
jgi:hypothetical protein